MFEYFGEPLYLLLFPWYNHNGSCAFYCVHVRNVCFSLFFCVSFCCNLFVK